MTIRKLNRLKDFDYLASGAYFITIYTKNRINFFGNIENCKVNLYNYGNLAKKYWKEIPKHYNDTIIDEFIIMPNHIHGIIMIFRKEQCSVPAKNNSIGLISKIIKSYKEIVTKSICNDYNVNNFCWQRSFHDHIIRNEEGLDKIREYIYYNPLKWEYDKDNINSIM